MNNELPQGFQDLTSKNISKKAHKLVSILYTGKCAKGRIKRMRTRHYAKYNKRRKVQNYIFRFMAWDFYPPIHRWNKH